MKEKLILEISNEMTGILSVEQLAKLNGVLLKSISKYTVSMGEQQAPSLATSNDTLLKAFLSAKQVEGCSQPTIRYYGNTIKLLADNMPKRFTDYSTEDIRAYLAVFQQKHNATRVTVDNVRRIFSSFFSWLEEEDFILKNPVRRIHKVKTGTQVREVLSDESLESIRDTCTRSRDLAMVDLLASTGMRVGELVKLNREDINFTERECVVFGKGNKQRIVYFNARTKIHLQQYLNERSDQNEALFVSLNNPQKRLQISGVEVRLRKIGRDANVPRVHPHKFRRTLATMAIDKGMPVEQVQKLLGHVKIDTTMHYAMVNQNNVKLSHRRFIS